MADAVRFDHIINQIQQLKLTSDKLFLLQQVTVLWVVDAKQLAKIVHCFPHSSDKRQAIQLLEKRICPELQANTIAGILQSCSLSKDRVEILETLVKKLARIEDVDVQKTLLSQFDSADYRQRAWKLVEEVLRRKGTENCSDMPESNPEHLQRLSLDLSDVEQLVKSLAEQRKENLTVFDLPIMSELSFVSGLIPPSVRKQVEQKVEISNCLRPTSCCGSQLRRHSYHIQHQPTQKPPLLSLPNRNKQNKFEDLTEDLNTNLNDLSEPKTETGVTVEQPTTKTETNQLPTTRNTQCSMPMQTKSNHGTSTFEVMCRLKTSRSSSYVR